MNRAISESAWRRGWNDTKTRLTSWPFVIVSSVISILLFLIGLLVLAWYWGVVLVISPFFVSWAYETISAPRKQRNEARKQVISLKTGKTQLKGKFFHDFDEEGYVRHQGHIIDFVDDDIDIRNRIAVDWALAYRVNAAMGDIAFFDTFGSPLDPSVPMEERDVIKYGQGSWRRVLIDATINWGLEPRPEWGGKRYPPLGTEISPAMQELIKKRWHEYGLS